MKSNVYNHSLTWQNSFRCDTVSEIATMPQSPGEIFKSDGRYIDAIFRHCHEGGWDDIWYAAEISILIAGVAANVALLWLFLRERKSLSASQVLGVNLVAMDLIFLSIMPFSLSHASHQNEWVGRNRSDFSANALTHHNTTQNPLEKARDVFSMFNLIGCPLLLTCMCIERYMAVIRPVLYLRARKWQHRMAVSAVVWVFTLTFCVAAALLQERTTMMVPVSIIISCLFVLMLFCLGGVIWSLQQQSPALTTCGNQARSESPLKRRAVGNVLVVVVPAVMAYLPVLLVVPMVLYIFCWNRLLDNAMCNIFELSLLSPMFGVFIGPLFYLSKARQMCCLSGTGKKCIG